MTATSLLTELHAAGITATVEGDQLRLDAPADTMTPDLLTAVKSYRAGLLEILQNRSLLPDGSGVGELHTTGARATLSQGSIPQSRADAEFDRFFACAVPTANGNGLRDPNNCSPELVEQLRVGGITWEDMERLEADCGRMGRGAKRG